MNSARRRFVISSIAGGPVLLMSNHAFSAPTHLSQNDSAAKAAGYVDHVKDVSALRFPQYKAGQDCSSCSLFQGKGSDAWGGCLIFGNKQVSREGWCSSYANM